MKSKLNDLGKIIGNPFIFRIVALVVYILQNVPSDLDIENIPMKIIFVWGILLIIRDFFTKRLMFKQPLSPIIVAILVSFFISVMLNFSYQFPNNAINWVYLAHTFLLIYPYDASIDNETTQKWVKRFNDTLIGIIAFLSAGSLLLYVFNIQYWVIDGTGTHWLRQGFMENRLFGLYTSPNFGSMLGFFSIVAILMNNIIKRGRWNKFQKFYIVNIVIQYLYYILANSRGTTLGLVSFGMFAVIYFVIKGWQTKTLRNPGKRISKLVLVLFLATSVTSTVERGLSYVPSVVENGIVLITGQDPSEDSADGTSGTKSSGGITPIEINRNDGDSEVSAGRFTIWTAGIKAMLQKPLFGLADADIYRGLSAYETTDQIDLSQLDQIDRKELKRAQGNMHNSYVSILVYSGIVGFVLIAIFAASFLFGHLKTVFESKFNLSNVNNQIYLLIVLALLSTLVTNLVETHIIFANRNSIGLIFWVWAGFLNYLKVTGELKTTKEGGLSKWLKNLVS